jgi:hypothetical protein
MSAVRYSLQERTEIAQLYGDHARTAKEVAEEFRNRHPDQPTPAESTVRRIVKKFRETASVADRPKKWGIKPATGEEIATGILAYFEVNPVTSTSHVAAEAGISKRSVLRVLHEHHLFPYKIRLVQELMPEDADRRLQFCEWAITNLDRNPDFAHYIIWCDEATFFLNGHVSKQGYRFWSPDNPHWSSESHSQKVQKLNVFIAIWDDQLIGPFIINGNLNSERYLTLLRDTVFPPIQHQIDVNLPWFMQDGAPAHFGLQVREYLDQVFPDKWIGRRGPVEWPPRSPDLTPCDFFLWGYLKSHVYANGPRTLQDLEQNIREICDRIVRNNLLEFVLQSWDQRIRDCVVADGGQFEHMRK